MNRRIPDEVLARHDVLVGSDNALQREARLLQALWRDQRGYPVALHRGLLLASRIETEIPRDTLATFFTDGIQSGRTERRSQRLSLRWSQDSYILSLHGSPERCHSRFSCARLELSE
jgi:hypothetical protein